LKLDRKEEKMKELNVKPLLIYQLPERKKQRSWRPWGGIQTEDDLKEEINRINKEIEELLHKIEFPCRILPLTPIDRKDKIDSQEINYSDVLLIYAAGGSVDILDKLTSYGKPVIFFIRHRSGPIYYWYEVIHPTFLRRKTDDISREDVGVEDIVIDDYDEILWRLRSIYGLKNTIGKRIIAVGGPSGWGEISGRDAPFLARKIWHLDIIDFPYPELGERIKKEKNKILNECERKAREYLQQGNITLETDEKFVINSFLLYKIFKDLLIEYKSDAITINYCMNTIMPLAETTACLPLSLLNDEGYLAFCESDFVVIPSGILLHHISGKPVFLNDPTTPHNGIVTLAHCTAPRKMDGKNYEPAKIVTHFESDYGASPKVEFKKGQQVTVIVPDFSGKLWIGFKGKILESPSFPICRSQVEVEIEGDWKKLLQKMRGFHWMMCYGDYLKEVGYALKKVGIKFEIV